MDPKIEERGHFLRGKVPTSIALMFLIASNVLRGHVLRGLAFAGTSSAARGHASILIALHFPPFFCGHVFRGQVPIVLRFPLARFAGTSTDCFTVSPLVYNYEDGSFSLEYAIYSGSKFSSVEVK